MENEITKEYISSIDFWESMFDPRTTAWQRKKLKELQTTNNVFETSEETKQNKIQALRNLLGK